MQWHLTSGLLWTGLVDVIISGKMGSRVREIWNSTGGGKLTVGIPRRISVVKISEKNRRRAFWSDERRMR
jgi:hypothetical protein